MADNNNDIQSLGQSLVELDQQNAEMLDNAESVALQLSYDGEVSISELESGIRFYQRRTAEAFLELGKRLLILKELTTHGEFATKVESLGFSQRSARRFMQAALKFSKSANLAVIAEKIGTQSKLLELVTIDDDELEALASGETVRGIELDDLDTLTASELKAKLKETQQNYEAQGKVLADKSALADDLATKLTAKEQAVQHADIDTIASELRSQATADAFAVEHAIGQRMGVTFAALEAHAEATGGNHHDMMLSLTLQIEKQLNGIRERFGLHATDLAANEADAYWETDLNTAQASAEAMQAEMENAHKDSAS